MTIALAPIADKLDPLIRRLASDSDAECLACVRAIERQLQRGGLSFHDLADRLLTTPESAAEIHTAPRNIADYAAACRWIIATDGGRLTARERRFVNDMAEILQRWPPRPKQAEWLRALVSKLGGLSCQWGPIESKKGKILSLILKPVPGVPQRRFAEVASRTIALLEEAADLNPVPSDGPDVRWPAAAIGLQSRVARRDRSLWWRRLEVTASAAFVWLVFKLGIRIGGFDPSVYRREMAVNTDFRKFDDSLMLTVDCAPEVIVRLRDLLDRAVAEGTARYGLHTQDKALMTCIAPSVQTSDHMHFVDGGDGGYAAAAAQLR